jgi:hypothetical protein
MASQVQVTRRRWELHGKRKRRERMRGCKRGLMSWVAVWVATGVLGIGGVPAEGAPGDALGGMGASASAPPFAACPEGTEAKLQSIALVDEEVRWCERSDPARGAVRHGPYQRIREGKVIDSGAYEDGLRHGPWTHVSGSGVTQEGEYRADRRVGVWVTRARDGEEIQRRDYGAAEPAGPEAAIGAQSSPTAPGFWTLRVENDRTGEVELALEPAGQSFVLSTGSSMELRASGLGPGEITIETSDEVITLRAQRGAELVPTAEAE